MTGLRAAVLAFLVSHAIPAVKLVRRVLVALARCWPGIVPHPWVMGILIWPI